MLDTSSMLGYAPPPESISNRDNGEHAADLAKNAVKQQFIVLAQQVFPYFGIMRRSANQHRIHCLPIHIVGDDKIKYDITPTSRPRLPVNEFHAI